MNKYTLVKQIFTLLVISAYQFKEKERSYTVTKLVGTVGRLLNFDQLEFRLFAFKHISRGKSDSYIDLEIQKTKNAMTNINIQELDQVNNQEVEETKIIEKREFQLMYSQHFDLSLTQKDTGEYGILKKLDFKLLFSHKKGEFNLIERKGDESKQAIKKFFELGNSTDQHMIFSHKDLNINDYDYSNHFSLEMINSAVNFNKNVLFMMDYIEENVSQNSVSYFQLRHRIDKKSNLLVLQLEQMKSQETTKYLFQKLANVFTTTADRAVKVAQKSKVIYSPNESSQLDMQYYQGDIEPIKKTRTIKDQQGKKHKEEYETDKMQITKNNLAKFKLTRGQDIIGEVKMEDKLDKIFKKSQDLDVYCQLMVDKMNMVTQKFVIQSSPDNQSFYTDDDRFLFVEECWNRVQSLIKCKLLTQTGVKIINLKQSQQFEKNIIKSQIRNEQSYNIESDQNFHVVQDEQMLFDQDRQNQELQLQDNAFDHIELNNSVLKRILAKNKRNQTIVRFELECQKLGSFKILI